VRTMYVRNDVMVLYVIVVPLSAARVMHNPHALRQNTTNALFS
jgi:hypothetical protein